MKKFNGTKPLATIIAQCKAQGVRLDMTLFRTKGWDSIVVGGPIDKRDVESHPSYFLVNGVPAYVIFNTFNGRFFGVTDRGIRFNSDSVEHEAEPWFQALLSFFYVEKS